MLQLDWHRWLFNDHLNLWSSYVFININVLISCGALQQNTKIGSQNVTCCVILECKFQTFLKLWTVVNYDQIYMEKNINIYQKVLNHPRIWSLPNHKNTKINPTASVADVYGTVKTHKSMGHNVLFSLLDSFSECNRIFISFLILFLMHPVRTLGMKHSWDFFSFFISK